MSWLIRLDVAIRCHAAVRALPVECVVDSHGQAEQDADAANDRSEHPGPRPCLAYVVSRT